MTITFSTHIRDAILSDMKLFCEGVRCENPVETLSFISAEKYLSSQAKYYLAVMNELGINPKGKKIFEIGAGYGFFIIYAIKNLGWDIYGIEPSAKDLSGRFELATSLLSENGIDNDRLICGAGEHIKRQSNTFDIVISSDVIEHVNNPEAVFREAYRVLKAGGLLIFNIPNYRWIYEGHYNLMWLPFISKSLAKKYVAWHGRESSYVDFLNFLTPTDIKVIIKKIPNAKICLPLEYKAFDFLSEKIEAYNCKGEKRDKSKFSLLINIFYLIFSMKPINFLFKIWAYVTGIYHEMHIVIMK